jgi:uncharacterized repeat protein (TIGR02543 family)
VVALEAIPSFGYVFNGWTGDVSGTDNPLFAVIDCNKRITASFSVDWRLIGTFIGCIVLVLFFVTVLLIRRKNPASVEEAAAGD